MTRSERARAALALLLVATGAAASADPQRGAEIYARCQGCHALAYDRTGPRHCGLFGRQAGTVPGFDYSPAMRAARLRWDAATLDRFLANPTATVPGTTMGYAGITDPGERADLIAWLAQASASPAQCGTSGGRQTPYR